MDFHLYPLKDSHSLGSITHLIHSLPLHLSSIHIHLILEISSQIPFLRLLFILTLSTHTELRGCVGTEGYSSSLTIDSNARSAVHTCHVRFYILIP